MNVKHIVIASLGALVVLLGMFLWLVFVDDRVMKGVPLGFNRWSSVTWVCAWVIWPFDFRDLVLGWWPRGIYWICLWLGKGMLYGVVFEWLTVVWLRVTGATLVAWIAVRAFSIPRRATRILDNSPVATSAMAGLVACIIFIMRCKDSYKWHANLAFVFWPLTIEFGVLYLSPLFCMPGRIGRIMRLIPVTFGVYAGVMLGVLLLLCFIVIFGSSAFVKRN